MPLIATDIRPVLHEDRVPPSIGVWMQNENGARFGKVNHPKSATCIRRSRFSTPAVSASKI
jgi:hypothetical protein